MNDSLNSRPPIAILGVPFDNVTCAQAIALIEGMIESGRPHYLVTANVDFLVQAGEDVELRRILVDAHLVLCDGTPLVWASRFLGNALPERVAGSDIVPKLLHVAAQKGYRVFFLGATPDSAQEAVSKLKQQHPNLVMAGHYSPPFAGLLDMDHDEIKRRIREARPDLLFVAFGCPKAEKWISMHYRELGVPVVAGVGATIDFLAGRVKRAPAWMQRVGAEWLFRLAQEPRRLARRYGKDLFVFGRRIVAQWLRLQVGKRPDPGSPPMQIQLVDDVLIATLPESLDIGATPDARRWMAPILSRGKDCLLDMSDVKFIDSTGVAILIRLQKRLRSIHKNMVLLSPGKSVRRALALMKLTDHFHIAQNVAAAAEIIAARRREEGLRVARRPAEPTPAVAWRGEITADSATEVWNQTRHLLEGPMPPQSVVIDLSGARFIDSAGVKIMVQTHQLARLRGTNLTFFGAQPAVRNVLRNAGLDLLLLEKPELLNLISTP